MPGGKLPTDVMDHIHDAVVCTDLEGIVIGWNLGAERVYGYPAAEALGRSILFLVPTEQHEWEATTLAEVLAGDLHRRVARVRRRDGNLRDVRVSYSPLCDHEQVIGVVGYGIDVTAETRAHEENTRHVAQLRLLQQVAATANLAPTVEVAVQSSLELLCAFTGWELAHAYLMDGDELASARLWHAADPERFEGFRRTTEQLGRASAMALPDAARDGAPFAWLVMALETARADVAAAAGLVTGCAFPIRVGREVVGVIELLSTRPHRIEIAPVMAEVMVSVGTQLGRVVERRRAEAALEASEAHFRSIFEAASTGMAKVSRDGRFLDANPALSRMLGADRADLIGRRLGTLVHPDDLGEHHRRWAEVDAGRIENASFEARIVSLLGETVHCQISAVWIRDDQGMPQFRVDVVEDLTARKRAEAALHELSARVLQLQDEERRRIARTLHESPAQDLAAIALDLKVVQEDAALTPRAQHALAEATNLTAKCSREIRTLSHVLHPPLLEELGLAPALRWYVDGFVQRSAIEVTLELDAALPRLPIELETALFRVVQESLTNIQRHSGSPSAYIHLASEAQQIVLQVADRGRGLPIAGSSGEPVHGVGLAAIRERVRHFGGQLVIDSDGAGVRLRVAVPHSVPR